MAGVAKTYGCLRTQPLSHSYMDEEDMLTEELRVHKGFQSQGPTVFPLPSFWTILLNGPPPPPTLVILHSSLDPAGDFPFHLHCHAL